MCFPFFRNTLDAMLANEAEKQTLRLDLFCPGLHVLFKLGLSSARGSRGMFTGK